MATAFDGIWSRPPANHKVFQVTAQLRSEPNSVDFVTDHELLHPVAEQLHVAGSDVLSGISIMILYGVQEGVVIGPHLGEMVHQTFSPVHLPPETQIRQALTLIVNRPRQQLEVIILRDLGFQPVEGRVRRGDLLRGLLCNGRLDPSRGLPEMNDVGTIRPEGAQTSDCASNHGMSLKELPNVEQVQRTHGDPIARTHDHQALRSEPVQGFSNRCTTETQLLPQDNVIETLPGPQFKGHDTILDFDVGLPHE